MPVSAAKQVNLPHHAANERGALLVGRSVGLLVYLGEALLIGGLWLTQRDALGPLSAWLGSLAFGLFGLAYLAQSRPGTTLGQQRAMAALMSGAAVIFNLVFSRLESYTALPLQVVSALMIVGVVPWRVTVCWITAQALALAWANAEGKPVLFGLLLFPGYALLQLFAAYLAFLSDQARSQRRELSRLNAELEAAHRAAEQASRLAERHRIARDLHDTLGHSLTALSLELEFAWQLASGPVAQAVERAQGINRQLLSDVRQTVSTVRAEDPDLRLSLIEHLQQLGEQFPALKLTFSGERELPLDPATCQVLLKCAREAVTNAVKHSSAREVRLSLSRGQDWAELQVENTAVSRAAPHESYGLRGMRERLLAVGGSLEIVCAAGLFRLEARVPLETQRAGTLP